MSWVRSGDYDRIIGGDYQRRDEPAEPLQEASDAVDHYTDRFRAAFSEAGQSVAEAGQQVAEAGQQLADWLRRRGSEAGEEQLGSDDDPNDEF
jgi:hypothetical protein